MFQIHEKRIGWNVRQRDEIFLTLPEDCRPVEPPLSEAYQSEIPNDAYDVKYLRMLGQFQCNQKNKNDLLQLATLLEEWKESYRRLKGSPSKKVTPDEK